MSNSLPADAPCGIPEGASPRQLSAACFRFQCVQIYRSFIVGGREKMRAADRAAEQIGGTLGRDVSVCSLQAWDRLLRDRGFAGLVLHVRKGDSASGWRFLPHRLMDLLVREDISGVQLAKRLNVTPGTVGNWLAGVSMPRFNLLAATCDIFSVSIDFFFTFADGPRGEIQPSKGGA